jgi:ACS family glucarate transporter-like MFS transporter
MQKDLRLSDSEMGLAFSAFAWAYALFEIPGGWLGDSIGPRPVLLRVVILWSIFTAATGWVWGVISLVIVRFLFGMGEAGCFPNLTKAFMLWLPVNRRTRAQSITWLSARWAGAFTPLVVIAVMSTLSWRHTFLFFALAGLIWAGLFQRFFPKTPASAAHSTVTPPSIIAGTPLRIPWRALLGSRTVWLLWAQYFCLTYGWFFYVTWLPTYLKETRGLQLDQNAFLSWTGGVAHQFLTTETTQKVLVALLAAIPLFFGGLGALVAGIVTPRLARRTGSLLRTRRTLAVVGFTGAALLLVFSFYIRDPLWAIIAMGLASFCNDLTMPGSWSTCMDVGGPYAGTLSGSMNMMGSIGAAIAPLLTGIVLDSTARNWMVTFWISGIVYLIGGICWFWLDSTTAITETSK